MKRIIFLIVFILTISTITIDDAYSGQNQRSFWIGVMNELNRQQNIFQQQYQQQLYLYQQAKYQAQLQREQVGYRQQLQEQQVAYQKQLAFLQEANVVRNFLFTVILMRGESYEGFKVIKDFIEKNRDFNNISDLEDMYFGKDKIEKGYTAIKGLHASNSLLDSIKNNALMELKNVKEATLIEIGAYEKIKGANVVTRFFYVKNLPKLENQAVRKFNIALRFGKELNKEIITYMKSNRAMFGDEIINLLGEFYEEE